VKLWTAATVNVSDADPASVPSRTDPFATFVPGSTVGTNNTTQTNFLASVTSLFNESGSTTGVFGVSQTKQALHASGLLHLNDNEPIRIYAQDGNISGLTLFHPKFAQINASNDISDVSFYLQNLAEDDISFVTARPGHLSPTTPPAHSAPRPSQRATPWRQDNLPWPATSTWAVRARFKSSRAVTWIWAPAFRTAMEPAQVCSLSATSAIWPLPFAGADVVMGAGLGAATSLMNSNLKIQDFIDTYVKGPDGDAYLQELGIDNFNTLDPEQQAKVAMDVFYLILRDAGRDFNDLTSPTYGTYTTGFEAIDTLFGSGTYSGDILARSRNIRTRTGGDISLFAPGGGLSLASTLAAGADSTTPPGIVTETGGRCPSSPTTT